MRRIWAAVALLLVSVGIGAAGNIITDKSTAEIIDTMQQIDALAADGKLQEAAAIGESFSERWEEIHGQLCFFLQHEDLDPIESVLSVLPHYAQSGEETLVRAECRMVIATAEHIEKNERLRIENIL